MAALYVISWTTALLTIGLAIFTRQWMVAIWAFTAGCWTFTAWMNERPHGTP